MLESRRFLFLAPTLYREIPKTVFPLLCLFYLFLLIFEVYPQCPEQSSSETHLLTRKITVSGTRVGRLGVFRPSLAIVTHPHHLHLFGHYRLYWRFSVSWPQRKRNHSVHGSMPIIQARLTTHRRNKN